jgi:hypothetical protein
MTEPLRSRAADDPAVPEPVHDPAAEPVQDPAAASVRDPATEPVQDLVPEPGRDPVLEPVVDFSRTAHRLRLVLTTIGTAAVVLWLVLGFVGDGLEPRLLAELLGLGLLLAFAVEVVVVGGAALRGMLRAGARGDRLASADVTLLPPQLTRRRRR